MLVCAWIIYAHEHVLLFLRISVVVGIGNLTLFTSFAFTAVVLEEYTHQLVRAHTRTRPDSSHATTWHTSVDGVSRKRCNLHDVGAPTRGDGGSVEFRRKLRNARRELEINAEKNPMYCGSAIGIQKRNRSKLYTNR